jgi:hypothetical protein
MQEIPKNIEFARQALKELLPELPSPLAYGLNYDEINFFGSHIQKPSKEAFEAKLKELIDAQPWKKLREERNKRLTECDWVTLRSVATDTSIPDEWKAYMQALRDLPSNTTDPENPVWPVAPN